ncbi:MAG: SBBP repeat-containing protein [Bacteroidota bacterium]
MKKLHTISVLLFTFLSIMTLSAQTLVNQEWVGTSGSLFRIYNFVTGGTDASGNIVIASNTLSSQGDHIILMVKYDAEGNTIWEHEYHGSTEDSGYRTIGVAAMTLANSDIYITGMEIVSGDSTDDDTTQFITMRLDSMGDEIWRRTHAGSYHGPATGTSIYYYPDSAFLFVSGSEAVAHDDLAYTLIKYDTAGNELFVSNYDSTGYMDIATGLIQLGQQWMFLGGVSGDTTTNWDVTAAAFNLHSGALEEVFRFYNFYGYMNRTVDVAKNAQGEVYILGATDSAGITKMHLLKLTQYLELIWEEEYLAPGSLGTEPKAMVLDAQTGTAVLTGISYKLNGGTDMVTVAFGIDSNLLWERSLSAANPAAAAKGNDVAIDQDKNIYVAGGLHNGTDLDYAFVSYKADGSMRFVKTYNHCSGCDDEAKYIFVTRGGAAVAGSSMGAAENVYVTLGYKMADAFIPADSLNVNTAYAFYENRGQILVNDSTVADSVFFYTNAGNPQLYVGDKRLSYVIGHTNNDSIPYVDTLYRIDFTIVPNMVGGEEYTNEKVFSDSKTTAFLNYYLGQLPEPITGVEGHNRVVQKEVYDGIDWHLCTTEEGIKNYFVVSPNMDATDIRFKYTGADEVKVEDNVLQLITSIGTIQFDTLKAYEMDEEGSIIAEIGITYDSLGIGEYGFVVDSYGVQNYLVVEHGCQPVGGPRSASDNLTWSTYFGGSKSDNGKDIDADQDGNIYATGQTASLDFPVSPGLIDSLPGPKSIFVSKFNTANQLVWSTYYGGGTPNSIATDRLNNVYIVGQTDDTSLITIPPSSPSGFYQDFLTCCLTDGFIARLNVNTGLLNYATYYGGISNDNFRAIAVDNKSNDIVIGGTTQGTDFPFAASLWEDFYDTLGKAVILQFDSAGNRLWATGFASDSNVFISYAMINDVAFDKNGNLLIAGETPSGHNYLPFRFSNCGYTQTHQAYYPTGLSNAFVAKFKHYIDSGLYNYYLYYSSEFGGVGNCGALCIAADTGNNFYIAGYTGNWIYFPFANPGNGAYYSDYNWNIANDRHDGFIAKFDTAGCLLWSTLFGGDQEDFFWEMDIDNMNNKYLIGYTNSPNNPSRYRDGYYFDTTYTINSSTDSKIFISSFNENDSLTWSTFYGGLGGHDAGGCKIVNDNDLYIVGSTSSGQGYSNPFDNFPLRWAAGDYIDTTFVNPNPYNFEPFIARFSLNDVIPTAIKKIDMSGESLSLRIYPNPNGGHFILEINSESVQDVQIEMFDLVGRKIFMDYENGSPYIKSFNLTELPEGVYFIKVIQGSEQQAVKFVKQ